VIIALLPLAYTEIYENGQINTQVSAARGNVLAVAEICSNYPQTYFLPFQFNPFFVKLIGSHANDIDAHLYQFSKCGYAEDGVGISLAAIGVVGVGGIVLHREWLNKRKTKLRTILSYPTSLVLGGISLAGLFAVLVGLPPLHILRIPTPSYILVTITSTWRVFAREYVDVNLCITVLFAIFLAYLVNHFRPRPKTLAILFCVLFLGIFVQYQAFPFFQGNTLAKFNYKTIPSAYTYIKNNKSIKTLAEYPMEPTMQSSSNLYYLTMQVIYKKPLRNSALSDGPGEMLDASIRNLNDPQTVPVLHALGINTVVVHGLTAGQVAQIPYLKVIYSETNVNAYRLLDNSRGLLVIAKIVGAPTPQRMLQFNSTLPVNEDTQLLPTQWPYEVPTNTVLGVTNVLKDEPSISIPYEDCFDIKMATQGDTSQLKMIIDNKKTEMVNLTDDYKQIEVMSSKTIRLDVSNGHDMMITKLGCAD
jgi:hypothetical protein